MRRYWILLLACAILAVAPESTAKANGTHAAHTTYNGRLFIAYSSSPNPTPLAIDKRTITWLKHPTQPKQKIALVPIDYHTKPAVVRLSSDLAITIQQAPYKQESIKVLDSSKIHPSKKEQKRIAKEREEVLAIYKHDLAITIQQAPYKQESIKVLDSSKIHPSKKEQKRIAKEREEVLAIYKHNRKATYWTKPFAYPVKRVTITSPFGGARVFNGEVRSFHSGTDFRAPQGTPIYAANDGVVVLAKDRFISGKSVVIDHGNGIYTTYFHNSKLLVRAGKFVRKGEKIALSGATGRVSGAHLHFGVVCNGVQIDPLDFIKQINALFGVSSSI